MTAIWQDVDPNHAEASLRGLNRRLHELEGALQNQASLLRARPDSFAFRLANESLLHLQTNLVQERAALLRHRVAEKIEIALDGGAFQNNTASIAALGALLMRLQKLYSSIAQAITQGPKLRGPIARNVMESSQLRLAATFPSSFGMSLIVQPRKDLLDNALPGDTLGTLFGLLDASASTDGIMALSGELGSRSISHFRHIATILARTDSELRLEWSDSAGLKHYWKATSGDATSALGRLGNISETRSETNTFIGRLVGASLLRNRFEIIRDDGSVVGGKITASATHQVAECFGQLCQATMDETDVVDSATGELRTYLALVNIRLLPVRSLLKDLA
jgi:hypothetical protein